MTSPRHLLYKLRPDDRPRNLSILLVSEMPCHHITENALGTGFDGVTMARNQAIKVPTINPIDRFVERRAIV